jgi:hypothetical protein
MAWSDRRLSYVAAGAFGAIAGESVTGTSLTFVIPLLPQEGLFAPVAAMLVLGFVAGATAGVLLLRRWHRRRDAEARAGAPGGAPQA